jgi:nucleoside-diphosphate-sugar epimerase
MRFRGFSGFLGSAVALQLLEAGYKGEYVSQPASDDVLSR